MNSLARILLTDTINGWLQPLAESTGRTMDFHRFTIPGRRPTGSGIIPAKDSATRATSRRYFSPRAHPPHLHPAIPWTQPFD